MTSRRQSYVFITQVYVPDPNATGQHLADVAEELARRGHEVTVYTSNRGYDDPSVYYPRKETRHRASADRIYFILYMTDERQRIRRLTERVACAG